MENLYTIFQAESIAIDVYACLGILRGLRGLLITISDSLVAVRVLDASVI